MAGIKSRSEQRRRPCQIRSGNTSIEIEHLLTSLYNSHHV